MEDEVIVAIDVAEQLKALGFRDVRVAHALREAERLIAEEIPDLALLDVNLRHGERTIDLGMELRDRGVGVVFASGYDKAELGAQLQSFDVLGKPIRREELVRSLASLAEGRWPKKNGGPKGPPV